MVAEKKSKICFVIAPIGEEQSEIRRRSDNVLDFIIRPAVEPYGYEVIRADKISEPGIITTQVIQHIFEDDIVIADLTGHNPNVYYELAIRHVVRKHVILIIQSGQKLPFDVAPARTISFDAQDLKSAESCKVEIKKQIESIEGDPEKVDSPISTAIAINTLQKSGNPTEESIAKIMLMLQEIKYSILKNTIQSSHAWNLMQSSLPMDFGSSNNLTSNHEKEFFTPFGGDRASASWTIRYEIVDDDREIKPVLEMITKFMIDTPNLSFEEANAKAKIMAGDLYEKYNIRIYRSDKPPKGS